MIRHFLMTAAAGLFALGAAPLSAQSTVAAYYMSIGPQDVVNSRGDRLSTFAQAIQQDRANYHRFGRRDPADEGDPIFSDRGARAQIPALIAAYDGNRWFEGRPRAGRTNFADYVVQVCARGGRISHIVVTYADGDGRDTCDGRISAGD